ncbi:MAG: hypothetical protein IT580_14985 [Verrucomicrobiales bacterium]|nr:hypothetical protein [Verrucomicrobiales bacterium]
MSLFSTFYAGEAGVLEAAARAGSTPYDTLPGVRSFDFSGGLLQHYLFPEDFQRLGQSGPDAFWSLTSASLAPGSDEGFHRVPEKECDRLAALPDAALRAFSRDWNERRALQIVRLTQSCSIWRSRPYYSITGGVTLGLLYSYVAHPESKAALFLLGAWLGMAATFGILKERRRRQRLRHRPTAEPVDWVPRLREWQVFLREARRHTTPVYYHWSL